jgi:hypothetical protein
MLPGTGLSGLPPTSFTRSRPGQVQRQPRQQARTGMLRGLGLSGIPPPPVLRMRPTLVQHQPAQRIRTGLTPGTGLSGIPPPPVLRNRVPLQRQPRHRLTAGMLPAPVQQARVRVQPSRLQRQPAQRLRAGILPPVTYPAMIQQARLRTVPSRLTRRPAGLLRTVMPPVPVPVLAASLLAGTVTSPAWGGTATPAASWAGIVTGGVMGVQLDQAAIVGNDTVYQMQILYNGVPLNLAGYTLKAYLKATRLTPDADAVVYQSGSGITITSAALGQFTLTVPHANLPNPSTLWYRVDVIDGSGNITTAIYGNFGVLPA